MDSATTNSRLYRSVAYALSGLVFIGLLAVFVLPNSSAIEMRNKERQVAVQAILDAVYRYSLDTGTAPISIPLASAEICRTNASDCRGLVDLGMLTRDSQYLREIPVDPKGASANGTGYWIEKTLAGKVTVEAQGAEGTTIRVGR
ncbi:hypothetical protein A2671_00985 [Candidatus Kaiserbacteria bacterium RIFCSPHIGHO2_01_FULL_49_13]|uniref:Type II secretion system protein GspG C-terminal domain-containing protein n=1 Tax=Candidatus Kaiserbacteria bacterium RIFCSPHIGHO2_01_FULL_49_13 TaxID=1798477 RepID=A0A1F6CFB6_9BACT|nr:MAG: hypothetical protein A2671_00985 [Candidatus Kaiserbacteria bacterium RIFCSPHIGHO2_01_FULL_49_13]